MTRIAITFIFLLSTIRLLSCDCAPIKNVDRALDHEYKYVDDVFIGDVKWFDKDSTNFEIIVCEVFKGGLKPEQKIKGVNEGLCGPFVSKTGEWIFLGTYSNKFKVHDCGLTTDLDEPWKILTPPPPLEKEKELGQDWLDKWKEKCRQEAYRQIKILRKKACAQQQINASRL